jgi:hypothetical protein
MMTDRRMVTFRIGPNPACSTTTFVAYASTRQSSIRTLLDEAVSRRPLGVEPAACGLKEGESGSRVWA